MSTVNKTHFKFDLSINSTTFIYRMNSYRLFRSIEIEVQYIVKNKYIYTYNKKTRSYSTEAVFPR